MNTVKLLSVLLCGLLLTCMCYIEALPEWHQMEGYCSFNSVHGPILIDKGVLSQQSPHTHISYQLSYTNQGDMCLNYNGGSTIWCVGVESLSPKSLEVIVNETETAVSIGLQFVNSSNHVYHRIDIGSRDIPRSLMGIELMGVVQILASGVLYFSILSPQCESDTRLVWRCEDRDQVVSGKCTEYDPFEDRVMCDMFGEDSMYRGDICCFEECCGHYAVDCTIQGVVTAIVTFFILVVLIVCCWKCDACCCCSKSARNTSIIPSSWLEEDDMIDTEPRHVLQAFSLFSWISRPSQLQ